MNGMVLNTDYSQVQPFSGGGSQLPVTTDKLGWLVVIKESGAKETKKKDGTMCAMKLEIIDGPHKGLVADHNVNVTNPSQEAMRIGQQEMSAIAHVTGVLRVGNSQELHNKPFRVLVRKQQGEDKYTEVYAYLDANGNEPGQAGRGPMQPQTFQQPPQTGFQAQPPQGGFQPQQPAQQWQQPPQGGFQQQPAQQPAQGGFQQQPAPGPAPGWAAPQTGGAPQGAPNWAAPGNG
jgi:hypothetical protein